MDTGSPDEQLELYETLCGSLQDSVILIDHEGHVIHANQRFCEAIETSAEALTGCHYTDLGEFTRGDALTELAEPIAAVLEGDDTERRVELPVHAPTEGDLVVDARLTSFEADDVSGVVVALRDVTEQVDQAEALATRSEQLARTSSN